jgi:hypothetical protein
MNIAEGRLDPPAWLENPYLAGAYLGGAAFAAGASAAGLGPAQRFARRALSAPPGSVTLGRRAENRRDYLVGPLAYQLLPDRFSHTQIVAPTGQAKTTLLEWIALQDLLAGLTVFVLGTGGDFGGKMVAHAKALGRPTVIFDPSRGDTLKWNPLVGHTDEDHEKVAEQAATTIWATGSAGGNADFFKNYSATVLRYIILAASTAARNGGVQPTLHEVIRFLVDEEYRDVSLDVTRSKDKRKDQDEEGAKGRRKKGRQRLTVDLRGLDQDVRMWFEKQFLGTWSQRARTEFSIGLQNELQKMLGRKVVRHSLSPEPEDPQVDFARALDCGGLVLFNLPHAAVGGLAAPALSMWALQRLQQETLDRPLKELSPPLFVYLDEVHNTLGHQQRAAAQSFSGWITQVRKYNVGIYMAYQAFAQLPTELLQVLAGGARQKLVAGGHDPEAAYAVQQMMGYHTAEQTDVRKTRRTFTLAPSTISVGRREQEEARYTIDAIRQLERGHWLYSETRSGKLQPARIIKGFRPPSPGSHGTAYGRLRRYLYAPEEMWPGAQMMPEARPEDAEPSEDGGGGEAGAA